MAEHTPFVILSSAYLAPVQYYTKLCHYPDALIEQNDNYIKQTYRNRCVIAAPGGIQTLTVPIEKYASAKCAMKDIRISNHGNWRHLHWMALESAYRNTPFFEYYMDDIRPFYEKKWDFLVDFNEELQHKMCELIDISCLQTRTAHFSPLGNQELVCSHTNDYRELIHPKLDFALDKTFHPVSYYQVFDQRHGFIPNLSVVDLLFNMGPESLIVLRQSYL